jgi:predicted deacylase
MAIESQAYTTLDYDKDGKQFGRLDVPLSTNRSGWASLFVDIAIIKNGEGPTAVLFGGNHGDEYEGPTALMKLARRLTPDQVTGRVIIVPALNPPAVDAGTRHSPIDGRNMNRAFPGQRDEVSVTGIIAHYVANELLPKADLVVDIHSGAVTAHWIPCVNMHHVADEKQMEQMLDAGKVWGTPYILIYRDIAGSGLMVRHAESLGKVTLGTEIGGSAQYGKEMVAITESGLDNVLRHAGILEGEIVKPEVETQVVAADRHEDYVMAPVGGVFEPFIELGDHVESGQSLGQIHSLERPFDEAFPVHAQTSGMVISRRQFPRTQRGDYLIAIVRPWNG